MCDLIGFCLTGRWDEAYGVEETPGGLRRAKAAQALPGFAVPTPDLGCSNGGGHMGGPGDALGCFCDISGFWVRAFGCLQNQGDPSRPRDTNLSC